MMKKQAFDFADAQKVALNSASALEDVFYSDTALYFHKNGMLFRLINEGKCGWRLQASAANDGTFCDVGASQSMALFMDEEVKGVKEPIMITCTEDAVLVRATDSTAARLSLGETFNLAFLNADGAVLSELTAITVADGKVRVEGKLADGEEVYGGGERFDRIHKRGTRVELYTSDGWNRSETSYLVVPLFLTTRGAGIFFNQFEPAIIDVGAAVADIWSYDMESDRLDCYFYATGKVEDVYFGYTELSGHAIVPTPWMHGVQICRSGPDMRSFDVDYSYDTLEELPNYEKLYLKRGEEYIKLTDATEEERRDVVVIYEPKDDGFKVAHLKNDAGRYYLCGYQSNPMGDSVKTIMNNFIREGMKPDAALMEGIGWGSCYNDNEESIKRRENLKRCVKWLHENGMKAMVYVRVGGDLRPDAKGYKDEYKLHANVEIFRPDGTTEYKENTTQIPWMVGTVANPDGSARGAHYLDITNDEALEWYFEQIWGDSIEFGIDGVKIDFCEVMPDGDKKYATTRTHYLWKNPDRIQQGVEHHAYASYFISKFCKRMQELQAEKKIGDGFMVLSRGGGIGSQRSPYMWAGDQVRTFDKLDDMLYSVVTSGLSGVPFMTYDMGGYHYQGKFGYYKEGQKEYETEVFTRAFEFTAFTSNIQTHGDIRHIYEMSEDAKELYRIYTGVHSQLIPYISKYAKIASDTGMPVVRHLVLKYLNDANVYGLQDEFMLGDGLLVAPIITEATNARDVYLPAGNWTNLLTGEKLSGGATVSVKANIGQISVFLNNDSPDAAELAPIFEGALWQKAKNWN